MSYSPSPNLPIDLHISQAIKERRQFLNLTQKNVAEQLGISVQQLQKYENGQNKVSASKLIELSKILHFNVASIFNVYQTYEATCLKEPDLQPETIEHTDFQQEALLLFSKIKNPASQKKTINMLTLIALEEPI
jgi:transcriptional regulator with XRE-family HTH domain